MFTFKQFFLIESPDFATFIVNGLQYNFKLGGKNATQEICFTILKDGSYISSNDIDFSDFKKANKFINVLLPTSSFKNTVNKTPFYTHIELRASFLLKTFEIGNTKEFLKRWDKLQNDIEIEGRAWQKNSMWFVSLHSNIETPNFVQIFKIINNYEFYLETKFNTRYINKDSFLPSSTPLKERSPHLQQKIDLLRRRLHLAVGDEKKAIISLLNYFDR
jgi:hypothetical protein